MERKNAKLAGLTHYFTGRPCEHGHIAERYTSNGSCIVCVRAQVAGYHALHAEARKKYEADYRAQHREQRNGYFRAYRAQHKEELAAYDRARRPRRVAPDHSAGKAAR
jgi:hypothetical protein